MKFERVTFEKMVFDPKSSIGADNTKSHFTTSEKDKYDIEFDPQNGYVQVTHGARSVIVPFSRVLEARLPKNGDVVASVKTIAVPVANGTYSIQPAYPAPSEPGPEPKPVLKKAKRAAASAAAPVM